MGTPGAGTSCKAPVPPPGRRGPLSWRAVLCSARAGGERPPAGTWRGNNLQEAWGRAARGWAAEGGSPGAGQGLGGGSAGAFAAGLGDPAPASAGGARSERAPRADGVPGVDVGLVIRCASAGARSRSAEAPVPRSHAWCFCGAGGRSAPSLGSPEPQSGPLGARSSEGGLG